MTTYAEFESGICSGRPYEAYDIYTDLEEHWRHTTASTDVEIDFQTYESGLVDRDKIEIEDNNEAKVVQIHLWRNHPLALRVVGGPIEGVTRVTIYRGYEGQSDDPIIYREVVLRNVSWDKNGTPTLHCEPDTSSAVRGGHRRRHQRICDHCLYGTGFAQCGLNEAEWTVSGTIATISGFVITATVFGTKTDGWFARGKITVGYAKRMITYHVGTTIKVDRVFASDVDVGSSFSASAGCDHVPDTCRDKFDNILNFGGNEFAPDQNIFEIGMGY